MSLSVKLKRGLDIRISGNAQKKLASPAAPDLYGVKPVDFPGLTPKMNVRPGDRVLAGSPLFHDKLRPEVLFTSPVSGKVLSVVRGERRKLLEVVVERDGNETVDFGKGDPATLPLDTIKQKLLASGLWPSIRQRPYHIVANPETAPKSIFISGFDTSPLAPDYNFIMDNSPASTFKTGLAVLRRLTGGRVNLVLNGRGESSQVLKNASGVDIHYVSGPHPAGNVGVQIHHIDPVNKGDIVWYVNLQDVITIGRLFEEGIYRPERIVALTGSEVIERQYYKVLSGCSVGPMVRDNVKPGHLRYISGNVLTGSKVEPEGFLGYYDSQVTVIPEGDYYEFFGWIKPGINKFSFSRSFLSRLFPKREYRLDTNYHGGERAFVITGVYEKVLPMDVFPMQLLKAIMADDIDQMENLGIYEVAEEDFALCEFVCPSKIEIQSVLRQGLDRMATEMS